MSFHACMFAVCSLCLSFAAQASAQIASPGKLSHAHAKLEGVNNCAQCHNFGEKSFRGNCLACHGEIKARIDREQGYHYFSRKLECAKCHKEHHGTNFALIRWEPASFDHKQTGFLLEGKHGGLECRKCHQAANIKAADIRRKGASVLKRTYLGLSTSCDNCHEDEHRGQLKDCAKCHGMEEWTRTRFDHDRARFRLEGRHAQAACGKCHPEKNDGEKRNGDTRYLQFKSVSFATCTACHDDHHKGTFGTDCQKCHSPAGWRQLRIAEGSFDHAKTHYPLEGRHAAVACAQCHSGGNFGKFKNADLRRCSTCHGDYHAGQFADRPEEGACEACHTVAGFSPSLFEPAKHATTRFPLRGAHAAIPCGRCHGEREIDGRRTRQFTWNERACMNCHDDPHAGQFDARIASQGCTGCHDEDSWHVLQFDHAATNFPLTGRHRDLLCDKCHKTRTVNGKRAVVFRMGEMRCDGCHEDEHRGQFVTDGGRTDCARCHDPGGWKQPRFDHATMSRFALTGRHESLSCERCHVRETRDGASFVRYRPLDFRCSGCHPGGG